MNCAFSLANAANSLPEGGRRGKDHARGSLVPNPYSPADARLDIFVSGIKPIEHREHLALKGLPELAPASLMSRHRSGHHAEEGISSPISDK